MYIIFIEDIIYWNKIWRYVMPNNGQGTSRNSILNLAYCQRSLKHSYGLKVSWCIWFSFNQGSQIKSPSLIHFKVTFNFFQTGIFLYYLKHCCDSEQIHTLEWWHEPGSLIGWYPYTNKCIHCGPSKSLEN